ncbi:hypothetical protein L2E82_19693 [Cichorium intybus]|uniref:Uncharacterized protein n=1 Tax=Cichorium intybus TaxID=13427 RepID=A0ACB9FCH7_CICIN|nr:hypothetical protein L2E82_19693 [Cichorium intybus]
MMNFNGFLSSCKAGLPPSSSVPVKCSNLHRLVNDGISLYNQFLDPNNFLGKWIGTAKKEDIPVEKALSDETLSDELSVRWKSNCFRCVYPVRFLTLRGLKAEAEVREEEEERESVVVRVKREMFNC